MATDFADLYVQYQNYLWKFCYHLTRDTEAASDLSQEVWLRAIGSGEEEIRMPRSFLLRIARNLRTDQWRYQARRGEYISIDDIGELADPDNLLDDLEERLEQREALRRAWGRLTEKQQEALLLWADHRPQSKFSKPLTGAQRALVNRGIKTLRSYAKVR